MQLPVCSQSGGYIPSWNLSNYVSPEEGPMDHPHGLWVPVEFRFLSDTHTKNKINKDTFLSSTLFHLSLNFKAGATLFNIFVKKYWQ